MTFFFNLLALRPCLRSVSLGANAQSAAPSGAGVAMCTWSGDVAELGTSSANACWKRGKQSYLDGGVSLLAFVQL